MWIWRSRSLGKEGHLIFRVPDKTQGNWKDLNEFFENVTEWEPSCSLYFGDNVLQDVLAPRKFTATIDVVAVSEELSAEGMAVSENNLVSMYTSNLLHFHFFQVCTYCHLLLL